MLMILKVKINHTLYTYLCHLRGNDRRGDGGQVLRTQV